MSLQVSIQQYELPNEGVQAAVLADIVDLGIQDTNFGKKDRARFVYLLEEVDEKGEQKRAFQTFTKSLNEKASLRKTLSQLGAKFDAGAIDLESYVGKQVSLVIGYEDGSDGKKYARIVSIMKPRAGQAVQIPDTFVRVKDRANT